MDTENTTLVKGSSTLGLQQNWLKSAVFIWVADPETAPRVEGFVRDGGDYSPLRATVAAGDMRVVSDPLTGHYTLYLEDEGEYMLDVIAAGHQKLSTLRSISVPSDQIPVIQSQYRHQIRSCSTSPSNLCRETLTQSALL